MPGLPTTLERMAGVVREFFRKHWQGALTVRQHLRLSEEAQHLLMAGGVGLVGGLTNFAAHSGNQFIKWLVWGQTGDLLTTAEHLRPWQILVIPALGGLAAGLVLWFGLRLLGNPGLSNLLEVVVAGDGRLSLRAALVNAISSIISVSTGASVGREGLIIQLSAAISSRLGRFAQWPPYRLRLLVACGAAAGISAGCNAPVAGAVFAAQIVLGNFSMQLFAPLVFSSVVAAVVSRSFFGIDPWYVVPDFDFTRLTQLPWFVPLGIVSGAVGALFLKSLRLGGEMSARLPMPLFARLGLAGLAVGGLALLFPEVLGNGYGGTNEILQQTISLEFLIGLFLAKFLATTVCGGVFTPTLFLGASLGSVFGGLLHSAGLGTTLPTGAFALVGMGSMLAATTHSPLLAMILILELSLNYSVMPPLMLACAVSTLVSRALHSESVYTEPLRRKGLELERESARLGAATEKTVADIMRAPVPPLRETATFREIADRFLVSPNNFLPVVDDTQRLVGIVALHDLKQHLHAGHELNSVIALDIMNRPPACLTPGQKISDVLPLLLASELRHVPVVSSQREFRLVGAVARAEALGLLSEAISASAPAVE